MEKAQWIRLLNLVPEALAVPADARAAFLDEACRRADGTIDAALRQEAHRLIAAHEAAEVAAALTSPVATFVADADDDGGSTAALLPARIGPWKPTRRLGAGGMGVVYAAERLDDSFDQHAALKLVRPGFGQDFSERFLRERALLAGLNHPGIARLLDGGLTHDGAPYLAMELVDGRPLTDYAAAHDLTLDQRLDLFLQTCDAVAYAHRNLVVHRDLKPANIYVHEGGDQPRVKLLDFGIARLLDTDDHLLTVTGAGPLTPAYAAPEQLTGAPITTATDVYALGVVLYELLTGRRPYDLDRKTAAQTERIVCTTIPKPPSAVAARERDRYRLRGDMDQIVLKALKKEPDRRYASAQALGEDLRRYLARQPVLAQPDTLGYRIRLFARRHRTGVVIAGAAMVLIVTLVTAFTLRLARERSLAEAAAREATAQAERAQAIAGFLEKILRAPNQRWYNEAEATGPETPVRAVLDEAARQLDVDFGDRPAIQADLHHILGDTYLALGLGEEAGRHHERVLTLRRQLYQPPHPKLAEALYYAANLTTHDGNLTRRFVRLQEAVAMQRARNEGNNFPFMAFELAHLLIAVGALDAAEALNREARRFVDTTFVPGHDGFRYRDPIHMALYRQQARLVLHRGDPAGAEAWMQRADSLGQRSSLTGRSAFKRWQASQCVWGPIFLRQGRHAEAERALLACRGEGSPRDLVPPMPKPEGYDAFPSGGVSLLHSRQAAMDLLALYEAWRRPDAAARYRDEAAHHQTRLDSLRTVYHRTNVPD